MDKTKAGILLEEINEVLHDYYGISGDEIDDAGDDEYNEEDEDNDDENDEDDDDDEDDDNAEY